MKRFEDCFNERKDLWSESWDYAGCVMDAVDTVVKAIRKRGRVFFFGNGGSAAQAQHLAAELMGRFMLERPAWSGIALSVDTSALTAIGNDYGFEYVFARQLQGLAYKGDVAIGLTTSGNSANVLSGFRAAREIGATTVAFTGNGGGDVVKLADINIVGPTGPSWKVQEVHLTLGHIMCELVEAKLATND